MKITPMTDSADYLFEQLNAENLSLGCEVERLKGNLVKRAEEIDSLRRENTLMKRFIEGYASEGVISAQDLLAKLKGEKVG